MSFDLRAKEVISNLSNRFKVEVSKKEPIISKYSVGIEIEVKFKYYFPELFDKYFKEGLWSSFSFEQQQRINREIDISEYAIKSALESTQECGIPKGKDKYWEFSFDPVNDLSLIIQKVDILKKINLIPPGRHSLHITIANLDIESRIYYVLMILELLFIDKERIREGFVIGKSSGTWAKKGFGGICPKNRFFLINETKGFEFRSLLLNVGTNETDLEYLFKLMVFLIETDEGLSFINSVKSEMLKLGLPDKNWKRPSLEPKIWELYIEKFDEFSITIKELINYEQRLDFIFRN